jgi:cytoskeletal protein CcmA (bactofilin family)
MRDLAVLRMISGVSMERGPARHLRWLSVALVLALMSIGVTSPVWALQEEQDDQVESSEQSSDEASEAVEPGSSGSADPDEDPDAESSESESWDDEDLDRDARDESRDEKYRERSRRRSVQKDTQVIVGRDLDIDEDEVVRDAVVIMGELEIDGKVRGDATAILGPVYVNGEVTGTVTAVGADVFLGPDAEIMGDVISVGGSVELEPGARVFGEVDEIDIGPALHFSDMPWSWQHSGPFWDDWQYGMAWEAFWTVFKWVLLLLVTSFIFLVAREPVERVSRSLSAEPWKAGLLGLATLMRVLPLVVVATIVLALSIIGIPLLILIWPFGLFALMIACLLGFTATAYTVGSWLADKFGWSSPYLALLVGIVSIQALSLVANFFGAISGFFYFFALMVGLAGWFVRFVAWTTGLGAVLLAYTEGRRSGGQPDPSVAVSQPATAPQPPVSPTGTSATPEVSPQAPPPTEVDGD